MRACNRFLSSFVVLALCAASCGPFAAPTAAAAADVPAVALDRPMAGKAAIAALGAHLPEVAAAHGLTAGSLENALRVDGTLFVDKQGRLFYREEPAPSPSAADAASGESLVAADAPLEQTFMLHSRPGSKRVIYLDFDGFTMTGTVWNGGPVPDPLVCPPWDTDGNPSIFSDAERTKIQQIWQRVAEDYGPFDVDVTTEDPGEAAMVRSDWTEEYFGVRVLISPISSYFGSYGGIAYVGVFDSPGSYYKPALVFPENLANGEKYIAEAAAHECGHTLGLLHDGTTTGSGYYSGHGTGETGWAPIMGAGYYSNLTQWSKGEYSLADNTQDDLAIINQNGCLTRTDDYPDAAAGAPAVGSGTVLAATGIVERTGDADVVSFNAGAGAVSISVNPLTRGPNLDVAIELRDQAGSAVASANPADAVSASISVSVSPGTYYLSIRGTGKGDPLGTGYTDYGSLGAWTLLGTVPDPGAGVPPVAVFTSSATRGPAPLEVTFDASGSHDAGGAIISHAWDFGDGTTGSGAIASHMFSQQGLYHVVLTATDNSGLTGTASTDIVVDAPNVPPVASFWSSAASGYSPLTVTLDGSESYDPDGSIVSWSWTFGDGGRGSGATVAHTYSQPGTYVATLTVTDNVGATGTATMTVTAWAAPVVTMHVASITLTIVPIRGGKSIKSSVRIVDQNGLPVPGATVRGVLSGMVAGNCSAVTGADGVAVLSSKGFKKSGTATFTVTQVTRTGYTYDATKNILTSVSIALASARAKLLRIRRAVSAWAATLLRFRRR